MSKREQADRAAHDENWRLRLVTDFDSPARAILGAWAHAYGITVPELQAAQDRKIEAEAAAQAMAWQIREDAKLAAEANAFCIAGGC